jgi:surface protein
MFQNCRFFGTLDVSSFRTSKVVDMTSLFEGCSSVTKLDVSQFDTSKVTSMAKMFSEVKVKTLFRFNKF